MSLESGCKAETVLSDDGRRLFAVCQAVGCSALSKLDSVPKNDIAWLELEIHTLCNAEKPTLQKTVELS